MNSYRAASITLFLLGGLLMLFDILGGGAATTPQLSTISTLLASIAAGVLSYGERK